VTGCARKEMVRSPTSFERERLGESERSDVSEITEMAQTLETDHNERAKVQSWRLHVLIEAGYPLPLAEKLADSDADLHEAVKLIGDGCTHETAARILL